MFNEPIHITDETYEKTVLQSSIPVIVDFWAPWCGPCKMVAPMLDKFAKEFEGKLLVAKINTDENPLDDGVRHSGNPYHVVRGKREDCPSPGWGAS
jgi:thiol-disulfide isomerase/thioredoxin